MDAIWIILTGSYSDINWHCYFTNEEDAKRYCEVKNKSTINSWDTYWYSKVDKFNDNFNVVKNAFVINVSCDFLIDINNITTKEVTGETLSGFYINVNYRDEPKGLIFNVVTHDLEHALKFVHDKVAQIKEEMLTNEVELSSSVFAHGGDICWVD